MTAHLIHLPPLVLLAPAAVLVAGAIGAVISWRGRRVGSHPVCRRCGYDLRGRPAESSACPECGAPLANPRAITTGQRVTRRRWLTVSVAAMLLGALPLGVCGLGAAKGVDWDHYKPQWWLLKEARGTDILARDAALGELARRISDKRMSDPELSALTDEALARQGDASKPWVSGWGGVIESAHNTGRLSDDKWRRYARQAILSSVTLWVRPIVRRNDELVTQVRSGPPRVASAIFYMYGPDPRPDQISGFAVSRPRFADQPIPLYELLDLGESRCEGTRIRADMWSKLHDGPQTVRVPMDVVAYDRPVAAGTPLVNENLVLTANFMLVPKDAPAVRLRTDAALAPVVRASVQVKSLTASENGTLLMVEPAMDKPPVPLYMTGVVRSGAQEWQSLTGMRVDAGQSRSITLRFRSGTLPDPPTFDLLLKPDLETASLRWNVEEIWGSDIVFPDVKVIRNEGAAHK